MAGCSVEVVAADGVSGYTTIQLKCELPDGAANVYAMSGVPGAVMSLPPAFQVPAPFGSDVGPTNAAFFSFNPDAEFDSYVTIGLEGPATTAGALSSIGIDFSGWSESAGIETDDGAVFFMDPTHGKLQNSESLGCVADHPISAAITLRTGAPAGGALVFAQLTVTNGAFARGGRASAVLQGRSVRGEDWGESGTGAVTWQW